MKIFRRKSLIASSGLVMALSLLSAQAPAQVSAQAPSAPTVAAEPRVAPVAATATGTGAVSPYAQSGPRNLIKRLQDTYISSTDNADHSQGHLLHVGTPDAGATKFRSFLRFDVSRLTGAHISKAYVRLYNSFVPAADCGKNPWFGVYRVAEPWNESTITWANQPTVGEGVGVNFGVGHPSTGCEDQPNPFLPDESKGILRVDVTEMVRAWTRPDTDTPNYGIRLSGSEGAPDPSTGVTGYHDFCSMNPTGATQDRACTKSYFAPTLEVEFNSGATPLITGNEYGPPYAGGYPVATEALEFLDSGNPAVWPDSKPYQRWLPDAYHSVEDASLKGADWKGGTSHKLRPGGVYGKQVLVTGDGASGFVGVIPYPALSGYHWAVNVKGAGEPGDLHGVELLPDGGVVAAFAGTRTVTGKVELYSREQGRPGSWSGAPVQSIPLNSAHEVLYEPVPDGGGFVWALGGLELLRFPYDTATKRLGDPDRFTLPENPKGEGAWGHDLTPVYGNPDRFWVGGNAGVAQFSKSGAANCHTEDDPAKWPALDQVNQVPNGVNHWCTDLANPLANSRTMLNSVGNDPVTGRVATTCSKNCGLGNLNPDGSYSYTTSWIEIVGPSDGKTAHRWSENSKHYKATWGVAAYQ
ncbi:DNRLRE domain-containing protein [Streptomyces tanashiensis]|uniref:DNRLRE domain-containing protein n=1 Tax=Streptomyces tanashiensis TaxID=67367 RepID=UPI00343A5F5D